MSKKENPLPKPPGKKFHEGEENTPILADRIAEALAGGRLNDFMKSEIPDSEQARTLVSMMMGMTGMLPPEGLKNTGEEESSGTSPEETSGEVPSAAGPPGDVREAARTGDMDRLVGLLKREQGKRRENETDSMLSEPVGDAATIGKEDIDQLLRIASDNGLSPDWIILRAIKLYVREYGKTGRL